jgi:hypothetical protein
MPWDAKLSIMLSVGGCFFQSNTANARVTHESTSLAVSDMIVSNQLVSHGILS